MFTYFFAPCCVSGLRLQNLIMEHVTLSPPNSPFACNVYFKNPCILMNALAQ